MLDGLALAETQQLSYAKEREGRVVGTYVQTQQCFMYWDVKKFMADTTCSLCPRRHDRVGNSKEDFRSENAVSPFLHMSGDTGLS